MGGLLALRVARQLRPNGLPVMRSQCLAQYAAPRRRLDSGAIDGIDFLVTIEPVADLLGLNAHRTGKGRLRPYVLACGQQGGPVRELIWFHLSAFHC